VIARHLSRQYWIIKKSRVLLENPELKECCRDSYSALTTISESSQHGPLRFGRWGRADYVSASREEAIVGRSLRVRVGLLALVAPTLCLSFAVQGVAGAAPSPKTAKPDVTCTKLTASATGKGSISGCTFSVDDGGKATIKADLNTSTGTTTWAKKDGVTTSSFTYATATVNKCPKDDTEIVETGTVTGSTGKSATKIKVGNVGVTDLCITSPDKVSLLKGTKYNI
jgi:hypothetical protein